MVGSETSLSPIRVKTNESTYTYLMNLYRFDMLVVQFLSVWFGIHHDADVVEQ